MQVGALPTGGSYIIMEYIEFGSSRGNQVRTEFLLFNLTMGVPIPNLLFDLSPVVSLY